MGSFEEVGDSGGMGMEESLLLNGNTIPTPVYLDKFGELGLYRCSCSAWVELRRRETAISTVGSMTRTNAYWILFNQY